MNNKIQNILNKYKELTNCEDMIFEKENDILSCVKSISAGEEGVRMRQKKAAVSLLKLKSNKKTLNTELKELCKSLDNISFNNKKLSSNIVSDCISEGICKDNLTILKQIFKSF